MSKIGKQPIIIPEGVTVEADEAAIIIKGPLGELRVKRAPGIKAEIGEGEIVCVEEYDDKQTRSNWGTFRALIANAIEGVSKGFEKSVILEGVGFRMEKKGESVVFSLGFSHPVEFVPQKGITLEVLKGGELKIKGIDKALVGETAARIRAQKKPEPYKGKGIRYATEVVRRKAGKKTGAAAG